MMFWIIVARGWSSSTDVACADNVIGAASAIATSTSRSSHDQLGMPKSLKTTGTPPLHFETNRGQTDPRVKFLARGRGYSLFLTTTEVVLVLRKSATPTARGHETRQLSTGTVLRLQLLGANPQPRITGLAMLPGKAHYFIGNDPQQWHTGVSTYASVRYAEIYPGIDLISYGNQGQLEYDFIVAPGANPKVITLAFEGAQRLHLDAQGTLILQTASGDLSLHKPRIYQEIGDVKQAVSGHYIVYPLPSRANENQGTHWVSFQVAAYDTSKPLIIDPVLSYSTYLGGSSGDQGHSIAVDAAGNTYITGMTGSADFSITIDSFQPESGDIINAFVTKVDTTGSVLLYSTYLGGSRSDQGHGIAVDATGNAYLTGETVSPDFPTTPEAVQPQHGGLAHPDAFVAKLDATGSVLLYSTYLGGSRSDRGHNIAVDTTGNAYITGETISSDFPTTPGAVQPKSHGNFDASVTKVNATGSMLLYSTYLGGNGSDQGHGIAVDAAGNTYLTGETASPDFPTTPEAVQPQHSGGIDAFVTKVDATGSVFLYFTYLGGSRSDQGHGITVDTIGNAYITGETFSFNFPMALPLSLDSNVRPDAFVAKIDATGSVLLYSIYLGGSRSDQGHGIAVDATDNVYITGMTFSTNFPTTAGAVQPESGGGFDAFVTKVHATGLGLTMTANPSPVLVDSDLTYAITVVNNGPDAATGVIVTDILPDSVALVSSSSSQGSCSGSSTVTCDLETINNGGSATVTIVITTPPTAGTLLNSASVTSSVPDPDTTDDSATVSTLVTTGEGDCFFDPLLGRVVCHPDIIVPGPIDRSSAGGCAMNPGGNIDSVLAAAVVLVLAYLGWIRSRRNHCRCRR